MPHFLRKTTLLTASLAAALAATLATASVASAEDHTLAVSPANVAWGYYSAQAKPALTVHSGDTVTIQTMSTCGPPERLEKLGVKPSDIPQYERDMYAKDAVTDKGPGGHILTGPVAIEEAELGDVLEIRILKVAIDVPFACNSFGAGRGFLPNDFPYSRTKLIPLNREHMTAQFAPGVTVPLHPFFGSMGLAPPESVGR